MDGPDRFREKRDNVDRLEDELFNIKSLTLYTTDGSFPFNGNSKVKEIVESQNYFCVKYESGKYFLIKWACIQRIEFE